jgi:hypothetical protein
MSIIIGDDGLEVGPPPEDDPIRQAHARLTGALAFELECAQQVHEVFDAHLQKHNGQLAALAARVAFLEQLLTGPAAAA